ncbi:uncharacterized protein LOC134018310 [Osmerus eperlanus]|uniref:uncharacterized protein LOC134018310 n=1 Tax=Osmerus eperlanus TaxID=29151 RepID=UPI002E0DB75E
MFLPTMQVAPLAIFLTFLALGCTSLSPVNRYGTANGTVTLTDKLEPGCVVWYTRTLTELYGDDIKATVVEKGKPTEMYKDKVKINDRVITLHEANYNHRGVYEVMCGIEKKVVEVIKLEMLGPFNSIVNGVEGGDGVYTFYEDTNGRTDIQVHLHKLLVNGSLEKLGQIPKSAGNAGTVLQGRAFLTDDGLSGRFSFSITNINHSDQGTYVIFVTGMYKETRDTLLKSAFQLQVRVKTMPPDGSKHLASTVLSIIVIGCVIVCLLARNGCISKDQILAVYRRIRRIQDAPLSNPIPVESNPEVRYEQVPDQHDTPIKNGSQVGENSSSVKLIDRCSILMPHIQGSTSSAAGEPDQGRI